MSLYEGYYALYLATFGEPEKVKDTLDPEQYLLEEGRLYRAKTVRKKKVVDTDAYIKYMESGRWPKEELPPEEETYKQISFNMFP